MNKIALSQIPKLLDTYIERYKTSGKHSNILFVAQEGSGRSSVIKNWCEERHITLSQDLYPLPLNGNPSQPYVIADDLIEELTEENTVLLEKRINYCRDQKGDSQLVQIFKDRKYTGFSGKAYDLDKLSLIIATAYPEDGLNPITPLNQEMFSLFDIYEVTPTLREVSEYLIKKNNRIVSKLRVDTEEDALYLRELEKANEQLEKLKLVDTVFPPLLPPCVLYDVIHFSSSDGNVNIVQEMRMHYRNALEQLRIKEIDETESFLKLIFDKTVDY